MTTYQLNAVRCDYCAHEEVTTWNIRDMRKVLKEQFGWSLEKVSGELRDICADCRERPDFRKMIDKEINGQINKERDS